MKMMNDALQCTIVWQKNWDAIHKACETCSGTGIVESVSCSWCGDGETKQPGSGKQYKYIVNKGSSRSSKTVSLIDCYDAYARANENKRLTVWRDTKTDCKKTVLNDALRRLKLTGRYKKDQEFNKTESIFTYNTGSTFEIHGTDDEETVHGLTQDAAWFNEPYKISKDTFDQIDQRTSDFIFIDLNPKKGHWSDDLTKDKRAVVIHSTFKDNPFCPIEQKRKILSYQPVQACDVVTMKLINYTDAREYDVEKNPLNFSKKHLNELIRCRENEFKKSADEFKWQVYGLGLKAERPHRIFRWNEIDLADYLKIDIKPVYGCDWGNVDPWAIVEGKYIDGKLYLRELNYKSENILRTEISGTDKIQIDSDQSDETAIEGGLVTWMFSKLQIDKSRDVICDTNRPLKIGALRRKGYRALTANKIKGSIIDGIDILSELDVYYTSDSENIRYEQENYSRKVDKYGEVEEEPEEGNDHLMDAARYIALHLQRIGIIKRI